MISETQIRELYENQKLGPVQISRVIHSSKEEVYAAIEKYGIERWDRNLQSSLMRRLIDEVWKRDNCTCQKCFRSRDRGYDGKFHVHHKIPWEHKQYRYLMNNLILLCSKCHRWVHSEKNINREFLQDPTVVTDYFAFR